MLGYIKETLLHVCDGVCEHAIWSENALVSLQKHHVAQLTARVHSQLLRVVQIYVFVLIPSQIVMSEGVVLIRLDYLRAWLRLQLLLSLGTARGKLNVLTHI